MLFSAQPQWWELFQFEFWNEYKTHEGEILMKETEEVWTLRISSLREKLWETLRTTQATLDL